MTVDEFVKRRILPEFSYIVAMIRKLMREMAPSAREEIAYGIPVWKGNKIFAVLSPTKKDITISFTHGRSFKDKYGLLRGVGKVSQHIKFKRLEDVQKGILSYYVKQALAFDTTSSSPGRKPGR